MQVHSIISSTISEEILASGHLSIRFMADGFSLLLEDHLYRPVILNRFTSDPALSLNSYIPACTDWLERHTLIDGFKGEVTILINDIPVNLVPENLFSEKDASVYLTPVSPVKSNEFIKYKLVKNRPFYTVCSIPSVALELGNQFSGNVRIMSPNEVILSMADNINASDHQRGFVLIENQEAFLGILVVKNDEVQLLNQLELNSQEDITYHTLNTVQQLKIDLKKVPLFYSGAPFTDELNTLKKYIAKILPLSYHIPEIDKSAILEHIVLAEATKCE